MKSEPDTKPTTADASHSGGVKAEKQQTEADASGQGSKERRSATYGIHEGYGYKGEIESIGVILALRTERFNNKVVFSTFAEKIRNYVLSNLYDARDIIPIIEELRDTTQDVVDDEPANLAPKDENDKVKAWLKMEQVKLHAKRLLTLKTNKQKLYGIVWGQMSSGLQAAIKGESDFKTESSKFNCIWLLEKGKLISSGIDEKANKVCTLLKAMTSMCTIRQGQNESNDSFRKRIEAVVLTVSLVGGDFMLYSTSVTVAKDPMDPKKEEINEDLERLKAMLMILRADFNRYGDLQDSLFDGMHKGRDEFPTTVVQAYDLLQRVSNDVYNNSYHQQKNNKRFTFRKNKQSTNLSFAQKGKTCELIPGKDGKVHEDIQCHNCHQMGHYSNQCPHKKKIALAHFTLAQNELEVIDKNWVLLDTCSTVSVFCNSELVHDIQACLPGTGLTVITNGGSQSYAHTAEFNMLPMKVHYNTHSIANILSLSDVANLPDTKLTMDTSKDRAILLHHKNKVFRFKECADGLYYWNAADSNTNKTKSAVTNYSFVNTVANNKS